MNLAKFKKEITKDNSIYFELPSEKISILVNALRLVTKDEEIKSKTLYIPEDCEKFGFVEGNHNLSKLLYFLADMLEE